MDGEETASRDESKLRTNQTAMELKRNIEPLLRKIVSSPKLIYNEIKPLDDKQGMLDDVGMTALSKQYRKERRKLNNENTILKKEYDEQLWANNESKNGRIILDLNPLSLHENHYYKIRRVIRKDPPKIELDGDDFMVGAMTGTLLGAILSFETISLLGAYSIAVLIGTVILCGLFPVFSGIIRHYFYGDFKALWNTPISNYRFDVPSFVIEQIKEQHKNYSNLSILHISNHTEVNPHLLNNKFSINIIAKDPILIGRPSANHRFASVLAMWGEDLEEIDTAFLSSNVSKKRVS